MQNAASDRLARRALLAGGAVEALLAALRKAGGGAAGGGALAAAAAGALMALTAADEGGGRGAQRFVDAGGIEAACAALAARPRAERGAGALRLRVLLAEVARAGGGTWEARVHTAAAVAAAAPGGAASS